LVRRRRRRKKKKERKKERKKQLLSLSFSFSFSSSSFPSLFFNDNLYPISTDAICYCFYRNLFVSVDSIGVFVWMQVIHFIEDGYSILRYWSYKCDWSRGLPNVWFFTAVADDVDERRAVLLDYGLKKQAQVISSLTMLLTAAFLHSGYNRALFPYENMAPVFFSELLWFLAIMLAIDIGTFIVWSVFIANLEVSSSTTPSSIYTKAALDSPAMMLRRFYQYPRHVWLILAAISLLAVQFLLLTLLQGQNMKHNLM
jgi:hypothetical protein